MPIEKPVLSNLDRLNRHVAPLEMKKFALGGTVQELMKPSPRNMIFPLPPPFLPSFGSGLRKKIPFGPPHA